MRRNVFLAAGLASVFAMSGCQCIDDTNLNSQPDAGNDPEEEVVPPVFPLKAGDTLTYPVIGGRTDQCEGGIEGACDRVVKGTYIVKDVQLGDDKRWDVTTDVLYEGQAEVIPASAISRLALENAADFAAVTIANSVAAEDAVFTTEKAPILDKGKWRENNFPFFQASNEINDGDNGEVFEEGALAFTEAMLEIDAEAAVETQVAVGKMEAYFKDNIGGEVSLHKLVVEMHPMGFICGWDESLIPFVEGETARSEAAFVGVTKPLAASFFQPTLVRDGVTYQCSCSSRTCFNGNVVSTRTCLDPTDPDAEPSNAACSP